MGPYFPPLPAGEHADAASSQQPVSRGHTAVLAVRRGSGPSADHDRRERSNQRDRQAEAHPGFSSAQIASAAPGRSRSAATASPARKHQPFGLGEAAPGSSRGMTGPQGLLACPGAVSRWPVATTGNRSPSRGEELVGRRAPDAGVAASSSCQCGSVEGRRHSFRDGPGRLPSFKAEAPARSLPRV